jgi:hypothetical protein
MGELKQIDIRIFAKTPEGVDTEAFMGVFQRWIQRHAMPGVLIDVADYGHIHHGHGTILIAHEYNLSVDYAGGKLAVLVRLKRPAEATLAARIESALRLGLKACRLLEQEEVFAGKLTFDPSSFVLVANDRLLAPNDDASFAALKPAVEASARAIFGTPATVERIKNDPRERLAMRVMAPKPVTLAALAGV